MDSIVSIHATVHNHSCPRFMQTFPSAIVSLVHVLSNGASAEIAVVGNEGIVGTP
jgi:hypothetical protein